MTKFRKKSESNWIDVLPTLSKGYKNCVHISTKFAPIQGSLKKSERYVYRILKNKRKKIKPKSEVNNLVRVSDLKRTF